MKAKPLIVTLEQCKDASQSNADKTVYIVQAGHKLVIPQDHTFGTNDLCYIKPMGRIADENENSEYKNDGKDGEGSYNAQGEYMMDSIELMGMLSF